MAPSFSAVFDACVLYLVVIRGFLLDLAQTGLFRAKWTARIHEEWIGAVLANRPGLKRADLQRTRRLMDAYVLDSIVTGYERLIPGLTLPDPDDRHVLAAAIRSGATVIVTINLKDFPAAALEPHKVVAQHPDGFVLGLIALSPEPVLEAARRTRADFVNPPLTHRAFLEALERQGLVKTVVWLRSHTGEF